MKTITVTYEGDVTNNFLEGLILEFDLDFDCTWCHKDILGLETKKAPAPDKLHHYYINYEISIDENDNRQVFACYLLKKYINFMLDNNMKLEVDTILDEVFKTDEDTSKDD